MKNHQTFLLILGMFTSSIFAQTPTRVDKGFGDPNETSICINKKAPHQLVGGSNIDFIYHSTDSGKNWNEYTAESELGIYGDPVLVSSDFGRVYYAHLSRNPEKNYPNWFDKIVLQYSDDGGKTFSEGTSIGYSLDKMQDKPWINIDHHLSSPYKNRVFVSWTQFDVYHSADPSHKSNIKVSFSTDSGASFKYSTIISDISGGCLDDDNSTEGATTASLPNGTVCAVWGAFGKIWFDKSKDGGVNWGKDKILVEQVEGWDMDIDQIYRTNGMPFLSCDASGGKNNGRLYLFYGDKKHGDADEWLMWSDNGGDTWTEPIRINTDLAGNGRDQFMGHFVLDWKTGDWYSIFYDRRHSNGSKELDVSLSWSAGDTIFNQRLTPNSFSSPGKTKFFGDYIGVDAHNNFIVPLWTEHHGDLQLFTLPINREKLQPTSNNYLPLYSEIKNKTLLIHYTNGLKGSITLTNKKLLFIKTKKVIKIDGIANKKDTYSLSIKPTKNLVITVDVSVPGTSYLEQTKYSFAK
jgi:hypothetical protein